MELLVRALTEENETVIDPFMGSGTTGVACAMQGRKFIGLEIDPKHFDVSCGRIEAAQAQRRLFA
jgi:site-specific DNA-methyltransferase (adenine-specific)